MKSVIFSSFFTDFLKKFKMEGVMIQSLKVVNSYGEDLTITLRNPRESGYIISGITGLEPVDVDIKQTQLVSGLKYKYNKGFHKYRQIQMNIIFNEWNSNNDTIDDLRQKLYRYFKTDDLVTLYFTKDINNNDNHYYITMDSDPGYTYKVGYNISSEWVAEFEPHSDGLLYSKGDYDVNTPIPMTGNYDGYAYQSLSGYIDDYGRLYCTQPVKDLMTLMIYEGGGDPVEADSTTDSVRFGEIRSIKGHVDKHTATYFSNSCGATLSIICSDPWFREVAVIDGEYVETKTVKSSTSSTSEGSINTAAINYKGDIQNGFLLKTETSVHNLHGEGLSIASNRQNVGDTGKAIINIPENYPDINVTPDILMADFRNDSVAISTSHDSDAGLPKFLCSRSWAVGDTHTFEEVNTSTPIEFEAMHSNNAKIVDAETNACTLFFDINDTELARLEEFEFQIVWDGSETGTIKGIPQYSALSKKYMLLITECNAPESEFAMRDDRMNSYDCGIGYIPSDKEWLDNGTPNNYGTQSEPMDHIGWLDATSISKRQELPKLIPGNNTITFVTSSKKSCKFKIEYSTLYRGL